jgi:hypothetical protein
VLITTAIFEIEEVGARRMEMGVMRGEGYVGVGIGCGGDGRNWGLEVVYRKDYGSVWCVSWTFRTICPED